LTPVSWGVKLFQLASQTETVVNAAEQGRAIVDVTADLGFEVMGEVGELC
jgi:hypothetical protein